MLSSSRLEVFRQRVAAHPANPLFRFSLGQELADAGAWAEALPHLELAAASRADWMLPRILLAKAHDALGHRADAHAAATAALSLALAQGHEEPAEELQAMLARWEAQMQR